MLYFCASFFLGGGGPAAFSMLLLLAIYYGFESCDLLDYYSNGSYVNLNVLSCCG